MLDFIELGLDIKHKIKIYTVKQKKGTNFLLCASVLILDRNW